MSTSKYLLAFLVVLLVIVILTNVLSEVNLLEIIFDKLVNEQVDQTQKIIEWKN